MRQYLRNAIQYDARRGRPAGLLTLGDAAGRRGAPPARGSRCPRQAPGPAAVPPGRPPSTAGRTLVNRTAAGPTRLSSTPSARRA